MTYIIKIVLVIYYFLISYIKPKSKLIKAFRGKKQSNYYKANSVGYKIQELIIGYEVPRQYPAQYYEVKK